MAIAGIIPRTTGALVGHYGIAGSSPTPTLGAFAGDMAGGFITGICPASTGSFNVTIGSACSLVSTMSPITGGFSGGTYALGGTTPEVVGSFVAITATVGAISATGHTPTARFTGAVTIPGTLVGVTPEPRISITGVVGGYGALVGQTPRIQPAFSAALGTRATLVGSAPKVVLALGGGAQVTATFSSVTPRAYAQFAGGATTSQVLVFVMNTITNAATTFEQFPYNSFAEIGGNYYAAGPSGLVQIDAGNTDLSNAPINAVLRTGMMDFRDSRLKRLSDFYIAMRSDGDIKLTVTCDELDPYEYYIRPHDIATLRQRKDLIGKGLRGRYWGFELSNIDGCNFDFDAYNMVVMPTDRRV
jgi:hypothetical protein